MIRVQRVAVRHWRTHKTYSIFQLYFIKRADDGRDPRHPDYQHAEGSAELRTAPRRRLAL